MSRVLVVDDEAPLRRALSMNLSARGYDVASAGDGTEALNLVAEQGFDVIILDLGLPDIDGLDVLRAIRTNDSTPIIVLSARISSTDKVEALDLGANDYVTKPFDINELLARLRAATRQVTHDVEKAPIRFGSVLVDLRAKTVERDGAPVHLTRTEWQLLELLLSQPGRLVSHRALLTELRGNPDYTDSSYLRIYMAQLRKKLEEDPGHPRYLITELGMGYRFNP